MTKVIITGSRGQMGQMLVTCAKRIPTIQVVGQVDLGDDLNQIVAQTDVVIDFSFHDATLGVAQACATHGKALVVGTTGHSEAEKQAIRSALKAVPAVWASNYSTGVNALFWLTEKAAGILGPSFDLEVVE